MLKTICCCFCIRRKSKVTVAPSVGGSGACCGVEHHKSRRILVQTAPGRFISVVLMTKSCLESITTTFANSRPQRNRQTFVLAENDLKGDINENKTSFIDETSKEDQDIEPELDTDQRKSKTFVVIVDIERPKTGDTISSRISLPPLRSGSPIVSALKIKKIKWDLRRRVATALENSTGQKRDQNQKLPKSISSNSIATNLISGDSDQHLNDQLQRIDVQKSIQNYETWKDEIVTLPGTNESEREVDLEQAQSKDCCINDVGSRVTLFFIHGVGGNCTIWHCQLKYFYDIGYNVIAIDLIGHGDSTAPSSKSAYTFESIKTDVLSIFDRFAKEKNVIIAHSYGTCFAAVLARERREKISHLVLISSGAPVPLDPNDGAFALPTPILALLRPALSRTFMKLAFIATPNPDDFESSFGSVKTRVLKRVMQGQRWSDGTFLYHQQIHSPTLLIYGGGDGLVSLDEMHQMRKAIPGSVLEVVDQAAHMVMLEQPENVNRLIEAFLRKTPPDGSIEEEAGVENEEQGFYMEKRNQRRPTTATSRTIPPSNVFKIPKHEGLIQVSRTVAVS